MKTKRGQLKPNRTALCSVLMLFLLSFAVNSEAVETTFELQRKIKSDFETMEKVNRQQEVITKSLNKDIKNIVTKLTNTSNERRKEELRKEYFKKRAEYLRAEATRVIEIETALSRIAKNMALLEQEMNKTLPGNHVKGLTQADTVYIKETLRGMANILAPLEQLRFNDPRVSNMVLTLTNLDMGYKTYFKPGANVNLSQQIQYLEDLHAYVYSVKILLRQETTYLKSNVYYMMRDGIVRVINSFQKHFYTTTFKSFENEHEMDQKVLGERAKTANDNYDSAPALSNIGDW